MVIKLPIFSIDKPTNCSNVSDSRNISVPCSFLLIRSIWCSNNSFQKNFSPLPLFPEASMCPRHKNMVKTQCISRPFKSFNLRDRLSPDSMFNEYFLLYFQQKELISILFKAQQNAEFIPNCIPYFIASSKALPISQVTQFASEMWTRLHRKQWQDQCRLK